MTINSFEKQAKTDEFKEFMDKNYPIVDEEKKTFESDEDDHSD